MNSLPIDPKAPRTSPQHPANWRQPDFREPGVILSGAYEPQAADAPPPGGTPVAEETKPAAAAPAAKKAAPKKTSRKSASDLAAALAKLGEQ